jgi:hypothetical protein
MPCPLAAALLSFRTLTAAAPLPAARTHNRVCGAETSCGPFHSDNDSGRVPWARCRNSCPTHGAFPVFLGTLFASTVGAIVPGTCKRTSCHQHTPPPHTHTHNSAQVQNSPEFWLFNECEDGTGRCVSPALYALVGLSPCLAAAYCHGPDELAVVVLVVLSG